MKVFLSHADTDKAWCGPFVEELGRQGLKVWYDKLSLYAGDQWVNALAKAIESHDVFMLIVTPDAMGSYWVQQEIALAMTLRKVIVLVRLKAADLDGFLKVIQAYDAIGHEPVAAARGVMPALNRAVAAPSPSAVVSSLQSLAPFAPRVHEESRQPAPAAPGSRGGSSAAPTPTPPPTTRADLEAAFGAANPFDLLDRGSPTPSHPVTPSPTSTPRHLTPPSDDDMIGADIFGGQDPYSVMQSGPGHPKPPGKDAGSLDLFGPGALQRFFRKLSSNGSGGSNSPDD